MFELIYKISLIGTFIVLIWYTIETAKIRRINTLQKDLQLMPVMMFYIREHSGSERLFIRNIGAGVGLLVKVLDASFAVGGHQHEYRFHLTDSNTTLRPDEEREVGINF